MGVSVATLDDSEQVISLWETCELTRPWNDAARDFAMAVNCATSDVLLLNVDEELVATVMVGFDGHRGWVYYLAVCPTRQGSGFGRALMQAAEMWLQEKDAPKIQLMVRSDNQGARGFYEAIGYEVQNVVTIGKMLP